MFTNTLEDAMFEVRRRWKLTVLLPLGIIVAFLLTVGIAVAVTWLTTDQGRPPAVNSQDIPLGSYAAGNIEVFDCIYRGPQDCDNYKQSQDWVSGATTGTLTYPPVAGDKSAPGEMVTDGARRVSDLQSLSDEEWHSLAAGVTREGAASPGTVTENSIRTSEFDMEQVSATATFTLTDETPVTGTMTFKLTDSGVVLENIAYTGGR